MSAIKTYLTVAALAVSLGACSTQSYYLEAVGPQQVATSLPEEVRMRLSSHPQASDTLGRDNPIAHAVQMFIEAAAAGKLDTRVLTDAIALGISAKGIVVMPSRLRPSRLSKPAHWSHPSPRTATRSLCKGCPVLAMKRS